jgi:hypothetical protein
MNKKISFGILALCLLAISGCTTISPLDINVEMVGNPESFHTKFEAGTNEVNITIRQEPSRLIIFPYDTDSKIENFRLDCRDPYDYDAIAFSLNLTNLEYDGFFKEVQLKDNEIIKYATMRDYSHHPIIEELNYTMARFECRIKSDFRLKYLEYIDGILIQNATTNCEYFWKDLGKADIICEQRCQLISSNSELATFIDYPVDYIKNNYIMGKCIDGVRR